VSGRREDEIDGKRPQHSEAPARHDRPHRIPCMIERGAMPHARSKLEHFAA
jgi:hypothetical protein